MGDDGVHQRLRSARRDRHRHRTGLLATLLYIDAIVSPGDTGLIYTTVTSRVSYAMARNGNAPKMLAKTTNRGVPLVSLIVAFVLGLIILLPFPSWQQLVGSSPRRPCCPLRRGL